MSWSYFANRLNGDGTETQIAADLELADVGITYNLSAPNTMNASIAPEIVRLKGTDGNPVFLPWSTAIYAEKDGLIRYGGIVTDLSMNDADLSLTTEGFAGYAYEMPYMTETEYIDADPIGIVKDIWEHLQGKVKGNLGLKVIGAGSDVRIGKPVRDVEFDTDEGESVAFETGPYKLNWYSTNDLGSVMDNLAESTPFDYTENHHWNGQEIEHTLSLHYPNRTRRRSDLRFFIGENVSIVPQVEQTGEDYASDVLVLGTGEGRKMVRGEHVTSPARLRRVKVLTDKSADNKRKARDIAKAESAYLAGQESIDQLTLINHPHALIGSFTAGDEIYLQGDAGWAGDVNLWLKIVSYTHNPDSETATLSVIRA